jgi:hypothetical protein
MTGLFFGRLMVWEGFPLVTGCWAAKEKLDHLTRFQVKLNWFMELVQRPQRILKSGTGMLT